MSRTSYILPVSARIRQVRVLARLSREQVERNDQKTLTSITEERVLTFQASEAFVPAPGVQVQ